LERQEIEIINSALDLEELFDLAANIVSYIVGSDVTLKSGRHLAIQKIRK
jgi:hypothetical protein